MRALLSHCLQQSVEFAPCNRPRRTDFRKQSAAGDFFKTNEGYRANRKPGRRPLGNHAGHKHRLQRNTPREPLGQDMPQQACFVR